MCRYVKVRSRGVPFRGVACSEGSVQFCDVT
jgi:hypothetical protein